MSSAGCSTTSSSKRRSIGASITTRRVSFQWQHGKGAWNWLRVTSPSDATKADVAAALYGDPTYAHTLTDAAPLFGFTNLDDMTFEVQASYQLALQTSKVDPNVGDDDKLDVPEQQMQGGGALSDEVLLREAARIKGSKVKPNEDGRLAIVERMRGGVQLFELLKKQKLPAGGYSNLLIGAEERL